MTRPFTAADKLACAEREVVCSHCQGRGTIVPKGLRADRIRERFDAKWLPDHEFGCWVWLASLNSHGYGAMSIGSRIDGSKRPGLAHRIAYQLYVGEIPAGMVLDHLCENRFCVNPDHLEPVWPAENTRRGNAGMAHRRRMATLTLCPHGHPYSGPNLYLTPSGARGCKACRHAAQTKWRKRHAV